MSDGRIKSLDETEYGLARRGGYRGEGGGCVRDLGENSTCEKPNLWGPLC